MDWKSMAIEKLKDYQAKRQALESIGVSAEEQEKILAIIHRAYRP